MARKSKKAPKVDPIVVARRGAVGIFLCGAFAIAFAIVEGFIFKSTGTYTGSRGTFMMDPITSVLMIGAGMIGSGFGVWLWFNPTKKL